MRRGKERRGLEKRGEDGRGGERRGDQRMGGEKSLVQGNSIHPSARKAVLDFQNEMVKISEADFRQWSISITNKKS